ncbi:MAG: hypothetical protein R2764_06470 [Bacteroidales bacterium]
MDSGLRLGFTIGWKYGWFGFYDDFSVEQAGVVTPVINQAYALSATAIDVIYNVDLTSVDPDDYSLTGSSRLYIQWSYH